MTKKVTEVNPFIEKMGNRSSTTERIPVVYMEDSESVVVEKDGKYSTKKQRYESGTNIVFKCKDCKDTIGSGKRTNQDEDKVQIYCYKCNTSHSFNGGIIWQKNPLWHKPLSADNRQQFDEAMKQFISKNSPEIVEI